MTHFSSNKDFLLFFIDLSIGFQVRLSSSFKKGKSFPTEDLLSDPFADPLMVDPFLEESSLTETEVDSDTELETLPEDATKNNVEESTDSDAESDLDDYDSDDSDDSDDSGKSFPGRYYTQITKHELPDFSREKDYPTYLIDTVESLIQLDVEYLSPDESKRSLNYVLRHIKGAIALLDRENVNFDELKKHVLDECKVLNRHVTDIDFYTDMFKNIQYLLIKRTVPAKEHIALNIELERLIVLLYSRLKAVIGSDIIRDELLVSPKLSLSAHSAIKRE